MNQYIVLFDFTTISVGGIFRGKSGQVGLNTDLEIEKVKQDEEEIKGLCTQYILSQKPKWEIFMINIKEIKQVKHDN